MSQFVQARCPQCKLVLRIPAEWVYQPMRCKHCGQVFQARQPPPAAPPPAPARPAAAPAPPAPVKPAAPAPAVPVKPAAAPPPPPARPAPTPAPARPAAPRQFPVAAPVAPPPRAALAALASKNGPALARNVPAQAAPPVPRRVRGPRRWWVPLTLCVAVVGLATVIGVVFGPEIGSLFNASPPPRKGPDLKLATFTPEVPKGDGGATKEEPKKAPDPKEKKGKGPDPKGKQEDKKGPGPKGEEKKGPDSKGGKDPTPPRPEPTTYEVATPQVTLKPGGTAEVRLRRKGGDLKELPLQFGSLDAGGKLIVKPAQFDAAKGEVTIVLKADPDVLAKEYTLKIMAEDLRASVKVTVLKPPEVTRYQLATPQVTVKQGEATQVRLTRQGGELKALALKIERPGAAGRLQVEGGSFAPTAREATFLIRAPKNAPAGRHLVKVTAGDFKADVTVLVEKAPVVVVKPKETPKGPRDELFPRRALFISINDYLYANPLNFGAGPRPGFPGSNTATLQQLLGGPPMKFPPRQMTHLSDGGPSPHPPLKVVIERTVLDFVDSSRPQDRIVLLFAGHVFEDEKEVYLVPIEGDLGDTKTLIPLSWLYDRLGDCKARQKVLILDVCRFDPAHGQERPGGAPMGKLLESQLLAPPAGVQVWSSCVLGQQSYEFGSGSVFLQSLCAVLQAQPKANSQTPETPLPIDALVPLVNAHLERLLAPHKLMKQTSRLTGSEAEGGAAPNPNEEAAQYVVVRPPPVSGGTARPAEVKTILDEMNRIPPVRAGRNSARESQLQPDKLPAFSTAKLKDFAPDYRPEELDAQAEKSPFRKAVLDAVKALNENSKKFVMIEEFKGANTGQVKGQIKDRQGAPGKAKFYLKEALEELHEAGKKRSAEKSKRWQALYDYVRMRLLARLIYVSEYNYVLAQIRTDSLPELPAGMTTYQLRLGSRAKVTVPEREVKEWVKDLKKLWKKITTDYPETPWAIIAHREELTALGLEWRAGRE
jgi:hypothetical protein